MSTQPDYYYDPNRAPDRRKRDRSKRSATWKVVEIQSIHHKIIQELHKGHSNRHIASELGVSEVMVSNVKNSPAVQDKLDILEAVAYQKSMDVRQEINDRAPEALQTLRELMQSKSTANSLRAKISFDLLDRAGFGAVKQVETKNLHAHRFIDEDDLKMLKKRAIELAAESGLTIEVRNEQEEESIQNQA